MELQTNNYQVVVFGATPGGIGAAISAARRNLKTLLIEPSAHIGGMMSGGLGRTDIRSLEASGSIFREFAAKVVEHYTNTYGADSQQVEQCNNGLWFEPSVAKQIFNQLLTNESSLDVILTCSLTDASVENDQLQSIIVESPDEKLKIDAYVFMDCSYEGDLAALAGVPYETGRESRDVWNEEYAGKIYMDFHPTKEVFPGSTGEGDELVQSYNFRLCLTQNKNNQVAIKKPPAYNRLDYVSLIDDVKFKRVNSIRDVMNMLPIPNDKTDCNNHHYCMCSTDLPEENGEYPDGDLQARNKIIDRHRQYIQGLLWFLQNDVELPETFRNDALQWGYAADEFVDTDNFPPQLYVREARRMKGEYTFTENDARLAPGLDRAPIHYDSIAIGDYAIDSHGTRKRQPEGNNKALEGFLGLGWITEIYQIPYSIMIPQKIDRLLVPVAISATHMGFGTIRMEPFWMQLGFAAGIAADLSLKTNTIPRNLSVDVLQDELLDSGQRITYFEDIDWNDEQRVAAEYFGTKGFFTSYYGQLDEPITVKEASMLLGHARQLLGGRSLPALPATDYILPAGVDMGPRIATEQQSPRDYWKENQLLKYPMASRWLKTACLALGINLEIHTNQNEEYITKGKFYSWLYQLIRTKRHEELGISKKAFIQHN